MTPPERRVPLTAADESYSHQLVAAMAQPIYQSPAWGDRCYHLLHVDDAGALFPVQIETVQ